MKTIHRYGFCVNLPDQFDIGERGREYAKNRGDVSLELTSCGADSVLIYRKQGRWPLERNFLSRLLAGINIGAYEMDTVIEQAQLVHFASRLAIRLTGKWHHKIWGQGPLKAVGVQCNEHFFVIEAAVNGPWDPDLDVVLESFEYTGAD